ncbi:SPFH domain-containing protein [Candidatus Woesearchaeota archaeon]|nr:SPFH domain-containing protein [Candidatus Woesearchaeota archaeon]
MMGYFKAEPTEYARMSVGGKVKREGRGISGFYWPHRTSIELVNVSTVEQPFAFEETSQDSQPLTFQGGFLYRVVDPKKVFAQYAFAINPKTKQPLSEDADNFSEHILQLVRKNTRRRVQANSLENLLTMSDQLTTEIFDELRSLPRINEVGVTIESLYFLAPQPTPEIAKALGAEYRESLLQRADKATYSRRALAVENERAIRENELTNQIGLEEGRTKLVALQGANLMEEARFKADAAKLDLDVMKGIEPDLLRAHALYELGRNATRIANLTITTDVLAGLKGAANGRG